MVACVRVRGCVEYVGEDMWTKSEGMQSRGRGRGHAVERERVRKRAYWYSIRMCQNVSGCVRRCHEVQVMSGCVMSIHRCDESE